MVKVAIDLEVLFRPWTGAYAMFQEIVQMAMSFSDAFRTFGATLVNPQWAYSAIARDKSLVISCWSHKLKLANRVLTYTDYLSRWKPNSPGKNLLIQHLEMARDQNLDIRLVIATTDQPEVVDRGDEAASIKKTFHVKESVIGKLTLFDGDNFAIEFRAK